MKLTTRGRYALQALIDLTTYSTGRAVKLADISQRQDLPIAYLEQLFRQLRIGGVVKSVRGPGGGYILAKDAADITLEAVFLSVHEVVSYSDLPVKEHHTSESDKVAQTILKLDSATKQFLSTTLASLL